MELGVIREALRVHPATETGDEKDGKRGAIERVAALVMKELEAAYPAAEMAAKI
jgi:hypothetical protein